MLRDSKIFVVSLLLCFGFITPVWAVIGFGIHYSMDASVKMNSANERLTFDQLKLNTNGFIDMPSTWSNTIFNPSDIPIYFDRGQMSRTPFGLGAKLYVDVIPFLDCIELNGTFVAFQYDGKIRYPKSLTVDSKAPSTPDELLQMMDKGLVTAEYDSLSTNYDDLRGTNGLKIPGISKTPYIKLDLELNLRKYINIPVIKTFLRPYGGAGFDCLFATPVPSAGLVNDAIGGSLTGSKTIDEIQKTMSDPKTAQKIVDEIINRLMTPHFGMNITAGFMLKPPVFPVGIYIDGKYIIPFGKLDTEADVTGFGFRLDTGLVLHF
jgi:hypothetical protein